MDSKINTDFKYNNFAEFIKNQDRYYEYFNLKKQVYQDESALLKDQDIIGSKNYWFTSFQKDNPLAFEYNVYVKPRGETIIILQ